MKPRFRLFAALFALLALSAFVAEGVWASTCSMDMDEPATPSVETAAPGGSCAAADMPMTQDEESGDTDGNRSEAPHCPLMPAGATGSCVVAVSLPAESSISLAPSPEGALLTLSPENARDILLVSAFFRPPKA